MNQRRLMGFSEAIAYAGTEEDRHLLLGNGFNVYLEKNIARYKDCYRFGQGELSGICSRFKTRDPEEIFSRVEQSRYAYKEEYLSIIKKELSKFIDNINSNGITSGMLEKIEKFLIYSIGINGRVFTTNYDLLLYRAICASGLFKEFEDGFVKTEEGDRIFDPQCSEMRLFFMHGGVHLYQRMNVDNRPVIHKLCYDRQRNVSITEQADHLIQCHHILPLLVCEGNQDQKLTKIKKSPYLRLSYTTLLHHTKGDLVIFGHSLANEDAHIWSAVNYDNGIKNIFVSVYEPDVPSAAFIHKKVAWWQKNYPHKRYFLYDAASVGGGAEESSFSDATLREDHFQEMV